MSTKAEVDERIKFFVGLDVHKDSVSIAACDASREPARFVGTVSSDVRQVLKVLSRAGEPSEVSVVYEAGPTGYGLCGELRRRGYRGNDAPSLRASIDWPIWPTTKLFPFMSR